MKSFQIHEISNEITHNLRLYSDHVRLLAPKLLYYAKNKRDFFILFELSKLQATRNQILRIIKKDQSTVEKLNELIKKRTNKTILKKIKNNEENYL
jgi:hypothetical protein